MPDNFFYPSFSRDVSFDQCNIGLCRENFAACLQPSNGGVKVEARYKSPNSISGALCIAIPTVVTLCLAVATFFVAARVLDCKGAE
jgi:hypothetical protein